MRKMLLIMMAIAMAMTVLSGSLSAAANEQSDVQSDFGENTVMSQLPLVAEDECEHNFTKWSYRNTSSIDGTKYHHRECRKCGYVEYESHENRYGGCSVCEYGSFDFSSVNLSDTADMTVAELIKYMGDVFGETNFDYEMNKHNCHFTLHRNFMNILASKYNYDDYGVIDRAERLHIYVNNPNSLSGYFYVMDGIRICSTYEEIINSSKALGYKVSTRIDSSGSNQVYIDNGKEILAFYYDERLAEYDPESANIDCVKNVDLYTCRDDFFGGSRHPAHDLSGLTLENVLGMEKEAGIAKLNEMFGTDTVNVDGNNSVFVNHEDGTENLDGFSFTAKLKQQNGKYVFSEFETEFKTDHADKKPKIISELPNVLSVAELNELLNKYGDDASTEVYYYNQSNLPSGAACTYYIFKLDDYIVTYSADNFITYKNGMYELISESELPHAKGSIINVALREKFSPADVNSDGEVTLDDAVLTLQKAMKVDMDSAVFIEQAADVNGDGEISLDDAVEILKVAMKVNS